MDNSRISHQLYQYMCKKVGNEDVVRARRMFFKVKDLANNGTRLKTEIIYSGSKAEGLDLPGSDIDIMLMDKTIVVHTELRSGKFSGKQNYKLLLDTKNTQPGFAKIFVLFPSSDWSSQYIYVQYLYTELCQTENGFLLPNTQLKRFYMNQFSVAYAYMKYFAQNAFESHGPCSTFSDGSVDTVFCFRLNNWPREALEWISRPRAYSWPPENLISDILSEEKSVLLVPIGSKFGAYGDNPNEWRISFSVAEAMLIRSFNHTHILCYAILKILLKQVIDKDAKNLLCSYFIKTLLFWLIEETGFSIWTPDNLLKCFQECIRKLLYHLQVGFFPNYFILNNNMFEGKIFGTSQTKLLEILKYVYNVGIHFTLMTETLKDFEVLNTGKQICRDKYIEYHQEDEAVYPLLQYQTFSYTSLEKNYLHLTAFKSNFIKSLFYLHFVQGCFWKAAEIGYCLTSTNKRCYHKYKILLSYLLIGTNFNLNSWLPLATFFYQHKQYFNTLEIIQFVCSEVTYKENVIISRSIQTEMYMLRTVRSFLKRIKLVCTIPLTITCRAGTVFDKSPVDILNITQLQKSDLYQTDQTYLSFLIFDESLHKIGHFLRFMCFHKLHDLKGRQRALCQFQETVDDSHITKDTFYYVLNSLYCLFQAYEISNTNPPEQNIVKLNDCIELVTDTLLFKNVSAHLNTLS